MAHIFFLDFFTLQNHLGEDDTLNFFDEYSCQNGVGSTTIFGKVWKVSFGLKKGNILAVLTMILVS